MSFLKVYQVLILYVLGSTGYPVYLHYQQHHVINTLHVLMTFFLTLNSLICLWEISLGLNITYIKSTYQKLLKKYGNNRLDAVVDFFFTEVGIVSDLFSLKFWSIVWSTYSLYDPSYSNRESFGFFVDVGNGWTTLIPSLLFLASMTYDITNLSPKYIGLIGVIKFYQELYGTIIYFLSFILNERYKGKPFVEVAGFVGISNGLWFFFPLLGMYVSVQLIMTDSYSILRV